VKEVALYVLNKNALIGSHFLELGGAIHPFYYKYECDPHLEAVMSNKKYFYVYYSYEPWGRGYIGKRECECLPEEDVKYFGSYRDKTFKPTEKIILETFDTLEKVLQAEILLHDFYQVDKNPHFANRAKATSTGFYFSANGKDNPFYGGKFENDVIEKIRNYQLSLGENHISKSEEFKKRRAERCRSENGPSKSDEAKAKMGVNISKALLTLGDQHPSKSEQFKESIRKHYKINGHPWTGRKHTEEAKEKMSKSGKGKNKGMKHTEERKNKLKNSKCKYVYTFISPQGEIFEVINANDFCKQHKMTDIGIYRVVNGKQDNYKGWKATRRPRTEEDK